MKLAVAVVLLPFASVAMLPGDADAQTRVRRQQAPAFAPHGWPAFEGREAWVAGRSRGGAACTIYSCPRTFNPGSALNPEGNIRPGGIP